MDILGVHVSFLQNSTYNHTKEGDPNHVRIYTPGRPTKCVHDHKSYNHLIIWFSVTLHLLSQCTNNKVLPSSMNIEYMQYQLKREKLQATSTFRIIRKN